MTTVDHHPTPMERLANRRHRALERSLAAQGEVDRIDQQMANAVAPLFPQVDEFDLKFSIYQECSKSPVGVCLYDDLDDSAHDQCLACGQPEERK